MKDESQGEDVRVGEGGDSAPTPTTGETDTPVAESSGGKETATEAEESASAADTEVDSGAPENYSIRLSKFRQQRDAERKKVAELEAKVQELEGRSTSQEQTSGAPGLAQKEQIKKTIEEMGFVPREEVQEMLRQKDDDDALKQELSRLENVYDGEDGRPKFDKNKVVKFALDRQIGDPEAAYKILNEKALTDWQIKQALNKSEGIQTEASTGTGAEAGVSDADLKKAVLEGDTAAKNTLLKRITKKALKTS